MRPVHYFIAFLTFFMLRSRGINPPTLRSFILSCENSDGGSWRSSCGARSPYKHGGQAWCYDWSIQRDVTLWLAELMKLLCAEPCGSNLARAHLRCYLLVDVKPRSLARPPMEFNLVKSRSLISSSLFFPVSFLARFLPLPGMTLPCHVWRHSDKRSGGNTYPRQQQHCHYHHRECAWWPFFNREEDPILSAGTFNMKKVEGGDNSNQRVRERTFSVEKSINF